MTNLAIPDIDHRDLEAEFDRRRTDLMGYCYRMLGSAFEADDAVQETFVRAWRGFGRFEGRSSLRSWLYRIATNVCLDMLNGRRRRALPMDLGPSSSGDHIVDEPASEVPWVQPVPDGRVLAPGADPAEVTAGQETIRLAFVATLQHLEPRPRAVLILRDVLRWQATEVAELLDMTATAVHSALRRARRTLAAHAADGPPPSSLDDTHRALLVRYVDAFQRYDVESLIALLHEDATMSMPPYLFWMHGLDAIGRWWRGEGSHCLGSRLVPTWANGSPAFGLYRPSPTGGHDAFAIQVMELSGGRISGIHSFLEPDLFPLFGLPTRLAA